jgi:hypothetical protein
MHFPTAYLFSSGKNWRFDVIYVSGQVEPREIEDELEELENWRILLTRTYRG